MNLQRRRRVIIYRLGSLGDTVVALPCLHMIERRYPDAERIVLTNFPVHAKSPPLEAILGDSGLAHRYVAYPSGTRSWKALLDLAMELRSLDADTLVYLTPARGLTAAWRDLLFFRLCGVRRVLGVPLSRALQGHRQDRDGLFEMECQRLARCMASVGPVDLESRSSWDLRLTVEEWACADRLLEPIAGHPRIAINMGGKVAINDWGVDNWGALVDRLGATLARHALVFVGGPEDSARVQEVRSRWPGEVLDLCGRSTPRVSAAAISTAKVFIGHDSGPMHLASCMNVPCVALFGENHPPRKWHPFGLQHRVLHDMRGVRSIPVAAVAGEVMGVLQRSGESAEASVDTFR